LYHLYIDESGDEGDYKGTSNVIGGSSQFFTLGGIIVRQEFRPQFTTELDKIKSDFFNNMILPPDFKLHYSELRERKYTYDKIKHLYDKLNGEKENRSLIVFSILLSQ
jgi:hypothetical protein